MIFGSWNIFSWWYFFSKQNDFTTLKYFLTSMAEICSLFYSGHRCLVSQCITVYIMALPAPLSNTDRLTQSDTAREHSRTVSAQRGERWGERRGIFADCLSFRSPLWYQGSGWGFGQNVSFWRSFPIRSMSWSWAWKCSEITNISYLCKCSTILLLPLTRPWKGRTERISFQMHELNWYNNLGK